MTEHRLGALSFSGESASGVLSKISEHIDDGSTEPMTVITPNIFHLKLASKDRMLAELFNLADIRVPDGWPVAAALRLFSAYKGGRIAGSDLSLDVLSLAEKRSYSVGIMGGSDHVLARAYENIRLEYPKLKIVEMSGNLTLPTNPTANSRRNFVETVNITPVDILLLCLGAPKSEAHLQASRSDLDVKAILCVGATVDFLAGSVKRAPSWVQRMGLEWAYRLAQEPSRLWRRYLSSGITFITVIMQEILVSIRRLNSKD